MRHTGVVVLVSLFVIGQTAVLDQNNIKNVVNNSKYGQNKVKVVDFVDYGSETVDFEKRNEYSNDDETDEENFREEINSGHERQLVVDEVTAFGYHNKIGIPKAEKLRKQELRRTQTRIIGGSQVTKADVIPHQAGIIALLTSGAQSVCGGSLISNTKVLTAAHCWWDGEQQAKSFTVVLGSITIFSGGTRIVTEAVLPHPSWNTKDITNDIAMVTIKKVNYDNNIQAIALPTTEDVNLDFAGMTATVSGFGKTSDDQVTSTTHLHQVSVTVIMNSVCQSSFQTVQLQSSHMCTSGAGKVGTCDGDSGGPLTVMHNQKITLVGIVSFGLDEGCQSGNPSVYTRVTAFLSWIQANMK